MLLEEERNVKVVFIPLHLKNLILKFLRVLQNRDLATLILLFSFTLPYVLYVYKNDFLFTLPYKLYFRKQLFVWGVQKFLEQDTSKTIKFQADSNREPWNHRKKGVNHYTL